MRNLLTQVSTRMILSLGGLAAATAMLFAGATASMAAGASADQLVIASQDCNANGQIKVTYAWAPAASGNQWLDLSLVPDNFTTTPVMSVGPITASMNTAVTDNLPAKTPYYVRINTNTGSGWAPGSTLSFTTRTCDGAPSVATGNGYGSSSSSGGGGYGGMGYGNGNAPGGADTGGDSGGGGGGY